MTPTSSFTSTIRSWLARLRDDRRGAAAVEFIFIAPILLSLYFVTMEVSQGIEANRKVGRMSSMVADLVTQQTCITTDRLQSIMEIGEAILQPYNRSDPAIHVTAITVTDALQAKVKWSRKLEGGTFGKDLDNQTVVDIPDDLLVKGSFLVRVSGKLDYRPMIAWTAEQKTALGLAAAFDNIEMQETFYLRPRISDEIPFQSSC